MAFSTVLIFASRRGWLWFRYALLSVLCGVLLYEYAGLKVVAFFCLLAGVPTVWRDFREVSRATFFTAILISGCVFATVVWPQALEIVRAQGGASFFDSIRRHLSGRSLDGLPLLGWTYLLQHVTFVLGELPSDTRLTPQGYGTYPFYLGTIFVSSLVWGLFSKRWLVLVIACCSAFSMLMASFLPANFEPLRITPAIVGMVFLSCMMLDGFVRVLCAQRVIPYRTTFFAVLLVSWATSLGYSNYTASKAWAVDPEVKSYFLEGDYVTCLFIEEQLPADVDRVELFSPRHGVFCGNHHDGHWLYRPGIHVTERGEPVEPLAFSERALIVIANRHGIVESDLLWLRASATRSGVGEIEIGRDLKGRIVAASFCNRCL